MSSVFGCKLGAECTQIAPSFNDSASPNHPITLLECMAGTTGLEPATSAVTDCALIVPATSALTTSAPDSALAGKTCGGGHLHRLIVQLPIRSLDKKKIRLSFRHHVESILALCLRATPAGLRTHCHPLSFQFPHRLPSVGTTSARKISLISFAESGLLFPTHQFSTKMKVEATCWTRRSGGIRSAVFRLP
jgi:hypothetical protein